jgi:formate hydrogenlyase subunit 6/NADH:ubiquinone oxidoreductase subunit I
MKYPKLRELKEALRALIKGPYTSRFPFEEHIPAERFRGLPEFHEEDCVGCGACANVCPARAIEVRDENDERTLVYRWDLCIYCGQCEANCLTGKGIKLSKKFDTASTGSRDELKQEIKKKLLLCDSCGGVIAPYDQVIWVAEKLGPLLYSNASLLNIYYKALALSSEENPTSAGIEEAGRAKRGEALCASCRRQAVFKS